MHLQRPEAHHAVLLVREVELAVAHGKEVFVHPVPRHARDCPPPGQRALERPEPLELPLVPTHAPAHVHGPAVRISGRITGVITGTTSSLG
jgi:hypothetical protein